MFERTKKDIELLRASLQGSSKAFGVLVGRYQSLVCAITYSATGSVERSEELAQEVFLRAWRSLSQLQDLNKFRGWLCSIARSTVQNWFRDRHRDVIGRAAPLDAVADRPSEESGPEEAAMIQEQKAIVQRALAEIPESLREPLILFYREQKSIEEVARQFDLTENAARQRICRGRSMLREQVARMVETTIARTRPGRAFTTAVIVCIAGTAVRSSAAVTVVGAASAAGKSAGLASLLSGTTAKIAAIAAGLALVTAGFLAYRQFVKSPEPEGADLAAATISQESLTEARPSVQLAAIGAMPGAKLDPVVPSAATPFEFRAKGVLCGLVTDVQTGAPVQDAIVRISLSRVYRCRTDANGFYSLESIPQDGTANLTVESKEYIGASAQDQNRVVSLSPDKQAVQHFQIQRVRP
ncbi:MAG TPA: sigma-70 family RNA polymerase sigma factor [Sedimentisphaerales bacterium]|jgi:RNA polymerase sigma factor (sigma-70 family)|nr:sigma-70 family RNA polymerase sigma factor [Sedimentisphaerales bacterium]HNU28535.1 sigma-70 family RNA polymerase sigma factor [Sedimentisphaerales bacterium]